MVFRSFGFGTCNTFPMIGGSVLGRHAPKGSLIYVEVEPNLSTWAMRILRMSTIEAEKIINTVVGAPYCNYNKLKPQTPVLFMKASNYLM